MEEKERYELSNSIEFAVRDNINKEFLSYKRVIDLLNQQYKQIAELKQQLHDLPKNILKDIQENFDWNQCCEIRKYYDQQYIWFNYVAFNDFLDTILKKYGGENE